MIACRMLPHTWGSGAANMALDETLLDLVAASPKMAIIRTYSWSVPTLSLGYFQPISAVAADPRWRGHPLVRRPTGGGALWHDHEVTYAVAIPAGHPLGRPSTALYEAVHAAIASQLVDVGIAAERRGIGWHSAAPTDLARPFLCFQDHDANDVVVDRTKLVGSAQRRRVGAVLQHGSLLLSRSKTTPELPGLTDIEPRLLTSLPQRDMVGWADLLREVLAHVVSDAVFSEKLSTTEQAHADRLQHQVYENPSWTNRR